MMKTISAAALAGVLFLAPACAIAETNTSETYRQLNLFGDVFERVRAEYVEPVDRRATDRERHQRHADVARPAFELHEPQELPATCRSRPAASSAASASKSRWRTASSRSSRRSTTRPPSEAGVQPGDLITQLDGEPVPGLTSPRPSKRCAARSAATIKVTIRRGEATEPFDVTLTRDDHQDPVGPLPPVEGDVGYIRVTTFNEQTADRPERGDRRAQEGDRQRQAARAMCSTCATTPAACSIRRSRCPTPSSTRARSSRPAAASRKTASATTPSPATSPTASRSSC